MEDSGTFLGLMVADNAFALSHFPFPDLGRALTASDTLQQALGSAAPVLRVGRQATGP